MRKSNRTQQVLIGLVAGGFVLTFGVFVFLMFNFSRIAKASIEYFGPRILGVSVKVDSVFFFPLVGKGGIYGLRIGNPKGYTSEYLMKLGAVTVSLEAGSVLKNPIRIKSISINNPEIFWEGTLSDSNFNHVQANVSHYAGPSASRKASPSSEEKRVAIKTLKVTGAHASAQLKNVASLSLALPDMELHDLGSGKNGATVKEVVSLVMSKMEQEIVNGIKSTPDLLGSVSKVVGGLKGLLGK